MEFSDSSDGVEKRIVDLFTETFTASEGAEEGDLIGRFADALLRDTAKDDIYVFTALDQGQFIGCAIFSRLIYAQDLREVFILSPMAVATDRQGHGIGRALLTHALSVLRDNGVSVAITYGDPAFYAKVGFFPLDEATAAPPLPLSFPYGWIGQSLTGTALLPLQGKSTCVSALNDPALW